MKTFYAAALVVIAGIVTGAGTAIATNSILRPNAAPVEQPAATAFVSTGQIVAPMVFPDGRMAGYVAFLVQLEIHPDDQAFVTERLPLLMHGINMRTFRTPLAGGIDGRLPSIDAFRKLVLASCIEAYGRHRVQRVAITQAMLQ